MKDYVIDLLNYYGIERTDRKGIWVKTDEGTIIPFINIKKENNMQEKIRIKKFYFNKYNNAWEWNLEILDKELALKGKGYEILPYKNNKEYIYIKYLDNGTYKLYDTGKCLTEREIEELRNYINEDINYSNQYYYIYSLLCDKYSILSSFDTDNEIDKQRKETGNYFKTYAQAERVWNKIKQIMKEG